MNSLKILGVIFFLLMYSIGLQANPITDLIKKAGTAKDFPKADRMIIFDSTKVEMQESGLSYFNTYTLHKVLSSKGANQLSSLVFDYDPLSAFVEIQMVVIHRLSGKTDTLDTKKVYDYAAPARAIYWGARQKMIEIGKLQVGEAIEIRTFKKGFTYALLQQSDDEKYIPPMKGHFYDIVPFWSDVPISLKHYEILVPTGKQLQYKVFHTEMHVVLDNKAGKNRFAFTLKDIFPIEKEENMVDLSDVAPKVLMSTAPDWQSKSRWFYSVNEEYGSFIPTLEVKNKVNELLKDAKNELDSISILTHWVADNMRYSGISMGKGEGFTLHNAQMNFTDRCGVCKDKASLLVTMLRAAGFEAYAAMTMAGSRIENIPADQFNHSVTAVRLKDGKLHLLDPTWVPFVRELWSSAEQQQNYLIGTEKGEDLMKTPISAPENHYIKIHGKSELLPDGTLKGMFILNAEGQSDAAFRGLFTRTYKSEWDNVVERELLKLSPLFQIDSLHYGNPFDYSQPIELYVEYTIPEYAIVTPKQIIFTPLLARQVFESQNGHLQINTDLETRKFPFTDRCSRLVEIEDKVKLPTYTQLMPFPVYEKVAGTGADFEGAYSVEGKVITIKMKSAFKKRVYEPTDWDSFRKAVLAIKKMRTDKIILIK